MDKFAQIDKIIMDLNTVTITGARNMAIIVGAIQALDALKKQLSEEEKGHAQDHNQ